MTNSQFDCMFHDHLLPRFHSINMVVHFGKCTQILACYSKKSMQHKYIIMSSTPSLLCDQTILPSKTDTTTISANIFWNI